ncbi:CBS domain-containing protein [Paenibacillus sp. PAMC21692]|uniref:CBS domain-containing protein n=1 Tax=Paenibacillus sp. PAMC21692 TaxID=2762320 RepID=UPI00164EC6B2|nr:CBS domain-containing protein [Paenibacillus sp. PAMC21692]QNK54988.1 CBS domain-containing protein [Paenibacillus sp. PAMC21692]
MKQVKDLMSTNCKTVTLQDNVYEVAVIMAQNDVGFVPVVETNDSAKLIGAITDRDLVVRGYAQKKQGSSSVSEVMSEALVTVSSTTDAEEAADIMAAHQIRRLPVVDDGRLVGVISLGDLALGNTTSRDAGQALSEISEHENQNAVH